MAFIETPLAIGTVHREFEAHVLSDLIRHDARMHGCPVWKVESKLDGAMAIWFKGPRNGLEWSGALRFEYPLLVEKHWAGDVNAIVETTLQLLDKVKRDTQPALIRAN